jgi:hypothetical protein
MNPLKIEIELPRDLLAALNIAESDLGRRAQEWVVLERSWIGNSRMPNGLILIRRDRLRGR